MCSADFDLMMGSTIQHFQRSRKTTDPDIESRGHSGDKQAVQQILGVNLETKFACGATNDMYVAFSPVLLHSARRWSVSLATIELAFFNTVKKTS